MQKRFIAVWPAGFIPVCFHRYSPDGGDVNLLFIVGENRLPVNMSYAMLPPLNNPILHFLFLEKKKVTKKIQGRPVPTFVGTAVPTRLLSRGAYFTFYPVA